MFDKIIIILVGVLFVFGLIYVINKILAQKSKKKNKKLSFNKGILILVGVLVVFSLVYVLKSGLLIQNNILGRVTGQHNTQRVAVFLTNGHVYFGFLTNNNKSYITLNDVYYLSGQDLVDSSKNIDSPDIKKISLIKMSNELHQPQSTMNISSNQILFFQNLRSDSRINLAINKFNSGPTSPENTPASAN